MNRLVVKTMDRPFRIAPEDRALAFTSDPHTYEQKGRYRILVKVIDIFGNDTSQAFDVEVR
jgi:adenine-specific DNA-methyltransferase